MSDVRKNCEVDNFLKDLIVFCKQECSPQKLMSRIAVNMTPIGNSYKELLKIMYQTPTTKNINDELQKIELIGQSLGKIVRVAISFDRLDRITGAYSDLYKDDDDDFDNWN